MNSLQEKIGWSDNKLLLSAKLEKSIIPIDIITKSYIQKIADYVESQIKEFLEDNKISERQWLKHGVIQSLPPEIGLKSYILYYKNWRMEVRRKVTVGYEFIIK